MFGAIVNIIKANPTAITFEYDGVENRMKNLLLPQTFHLPTCNAEAKINIR